MTSRQIVNVLKKNLSSSAALRNGTHSSSNQSPQQSSQSTQSVPLQNVTGLSSQIILKREGPIGPNDSKNEYKVKEYFCYDRSSYFQAEIEMAKYRLPQPSALKSEGK
ncbi:uncharacterized protein LOC113389054 [Ctenocephalides felis]|uniref:uncharacterized protein LOC113389054 n=1 Tax=Ctenocephalides felis TaxID=7515 RepID=UPI000E6E40B7|nr:uncharacterized protein LOC113389054 [Ctenocephalides felis]